MQAGFAFLGAGLIRAKNTANYMTKSFLDFVMASPSFWAFGFALMWGTRGRRVVTSVLLIQAWVCEKRNKELTSWQSVCNTLDYNGN